MNLFSFSITRSFMKDFLNNIFITGNSQQLYITQSSSKKPHLLHDGYRYTLNRSVKDKNYWECLKKKSKNNLKCLARITTHGNEIKLVTGQHTCHLINK